MTKKERSIRNRKRYYERFFEEAMDDNATELVIFPGEETCAWADPIRDTYGGKGYAVSHNPLISLGYGGCNGVAIVSPTYGGLSHYNIDQYFCKEHTSALIEEFIKKNKGRLCRAVLIGGNRSHAELNREVLAKEGIPLMGMYIDGYGFENPATLERERAKDVVVLPQRQEVIVRIKLDTKSSLEEDICEDHAYLSFKIGRKARGFL